MADFGQALADWVLLGATYALLQRRSPAAPPSGLGTYVGVLELEMSGRWVISARVTKPVTDQFTYVVDIDWVP